MHKLDDEASSGSIKCCICLGTAPAKGAKAREFLKGCCVANAINDKNNVYGQIYMNGYVTHSTHNLRYQNGRYMCVKCGYNAAVRLHKLKGPCVRPEARTAYGNEMLKRMAAGGFEHTRPQVARSSSSLTPHEANIVNAYQEHVDNIGNAGNPGEGNDESENMSESEPDVPELPMIADQVEMGSAESDDDAD